MATSLAAQPQNQSPPPLQYADDPIVPDSAFEEALPPLDPALSEPYRPYHTHDEKQPLTPGRVYELDVEIWPTSIVVPKDHTLGLTILGRDFDHGRGRGAEGMLSLDSTGVGPFVHNDPGDRPIEILRATRITVYSGPDHPSELLLPVIPDVETV